LATVLTSNNAQIFRQLGSRQFRAAPLVHEVATSAEALLDRARRSRPELVILDDPLPGGSGFDVCRRIKEDPDLAGTRVMLILDNPATQEQLRRAEASRCDDILCLPAPSDELFGHIATVLGFAAGESRREKERLMAELTLAGSTSTLRGEVLDLAETAARVRIPGRIAPPGRIAVRLARGMTGAAHEVDATVSWQRQSAAGDWELGLKLAPIDPPVLARLRSSCLWDLTATDVGVQVALRGDLVESVDFDALRAALEARPGGDLIELDLSRISRVNSVGACRWAELVHALRGRRLSFLRCSLDFTSHAAMTVGMIGSGRVESVFAPYACERCGASELRLLQVAALLDGDRVRPPVLRCGACGGELLFDDLPERYFSFLSA
jgi:CheY-like chemotaxis protein